MNSSQSGYRNCASNSIRANCVIGSWSEKRANLVITVANPDDPGAPVLMPVIYNPKQGEQFRAGDIARVTIRREENRASRKSELIATNIQRAKGPPTELAHHVAVKYRIILGQDGHQQRPQRNLQRQPKGPPPSPDDGPSRNGFSPGKGSNRDSFDGLGDNQQKNENPASGDAAGSLPLSPSCSLPAGSVLSESQQILPKQINVLADEGSSKTEPCKHEVVEAQLFGINAEVNKSKKIAFKDDGCTYYGELEDYVEVTDENGNSNRRERVSVVCQIEAGQHVLADIKVGHGYAKVFGLKMFDSAQMDSQFLGADEEQESEQYLTRANDVNATEQVEEQYYEINQPEYDPADEEALSVEVETDGSNPAIQDQEVPQPEIPSEIIIAGSAEVPSSVQSYSGEFDPVATEDDELKEADQLEEKLASIYSCTNLVKKLPSVVGAPVLEPITEEAGNSARQIAESAALDAVQMFMQKFLKYDEIAVEAMVEAFQKKVLASITEKYD